MAQDKIIRQVSDQLDDVRETLRGLEEVSDYPETVAAMRELVHLIIEMFREPDPPDGDEGRARQFVINAAIELSHRLLNDGIA